MIGILNKNGFWLQNVALDSKENFSDEFYNFGIVYDSNLSLFKPKLVDDTYIEGATEEEIEAYNDQFYPEKVTGLQFKTQLLTDGLKDDVENALNNLPEPDKSYALLKYQNATEFIRKDPLIQQLGSLLGMTKTDINEFFKRANQK